MEAKKNIKKTSKANKEVKTFDATVDLTNCKTQSEMINVLEKDTKARKSVKKQNKEIKAEAEQRVATATKPAEKSFWKKIITAIKKLF